MVTIEDIKILYEDKYLIVVVKPCGMPSQKGKDDQVDLLSLLSTKYKDVYLVHRLDTSTGGIMVYARGSRAAAALSSLVQDHTAFKKDYLVVLDKELDKEGELIDYLYHDKRQNKSFVVKNDRKGAKEAILSYKNVARDNEGHPLVLVTLKTGRSHQIRIQFASRKSPVYGDGKYGSRLKMKGFALWAYKLTFKHPLENKIIELSCLPDKDLTPWNIFAEALSSL